MQRQTLLAKIRLEMLCVSQLHMPLFFRITSVYISHCFKVKVKRPYQLKKNLKNLNKNKKYLNKLTSRHKHQVLHL